MSDEKIICNNIGYFKGIDHQAWLKNINEDNDERPPGAPPGYFLLRTTDTSPFARKVRITAHELGLAEQIVMSPASFDLEDTEITRANPLGKIPTIEDDKGNIFFESALIVRFLCSLRPDLSKRILPTHSNLALFNSKIESVADMATSAALAAVMEKRMHGDENVSKQWIDRQNGKVTRSLEFLSHNLSDLSMSHSGSIATACFLGYLDWRGPQWRGNYPSLVTWLESFEEKIPAYRLTNTL